ncbi:MAG: TRAP transporter small permease, partial [Desulfobacterales bacterium]|nr:TRAP transporter small permease [Desulfobacterales bacterium]
MDAENAAPSPPSPIAESGPADRNKTPFYFRVLDDFALLLFALLLVVATAQVLFRYVLIMPLPWTEELARFLLVWVTFLGAASITRRKLHIAVEYFIARFPPRSVPPVRCGVYLLMALFLGIFLWGVLVM